MKGCITFPYTFPRPSLSCSNRLFQMLPFSVQKIKDNRISDTHWHDYLQIWYTISGEYRHTLNGVTYTQKPGNAMIIFPYAIHNIDTSASNLSETEVVSISIKKDELLLRSIPFIAHTYCDASFNLQRLSPVIFLSGNEKNAADNLFYDILDEYNKKTSMTYSKIFSCITDILELCLNNSSDYLSKKEALSLQERFQQIDNSMDFLLKNISKKLTIDELSKSAMMSKRSYSSSFLSTIGQTPHDYIIRLRMNNAIHFLRKTDLSIEEIAIQCGFCHSSHFSKTCKELCGISPYAYRRHLSEWTRNIGYPLYKQAVKEESWALSFDEECAERLWFAMSN